MIMWTKKTMVRQKRNHITDIKRYWKKAKYFRLRFKISLLWGNLVEGFKQKIENLKNKKRNENLS